jgi:hypothetical protein
MQPAATPDQTQPNGLQQSNPSLFSSPAETPSPMGAPASEQSPSFFSNPSPATTDPQQAAPTEPTMVNPYGSAPATPQPTTFTDTMQQPLPSPAAVNQGLQKETSPLLRVLYIVGAVIFFIIYTIFWIKIFNLPLPLPF